MAAWGRVAAGRLRRLRGARDPCGSDCWVLSINPWIWASLREFALSEPPGGGSILSDFGGSVRGGLEPRDDWSPPGGGSNLSYFWRLGSWRPGAAWRLVGCAGCEALGTLTGLAAEFFQLRSGFGQALGNSHFRSPPAEGLF